MAVNKITLNEFLELSKSNPVFDVRSPGEYSHAHFPNAYNLPLFSDEERKVVGTLYKQQSREAAIKKGLEYFGPKMLSLLQLVENIEHTKDKKILVHCWRGGMRSAGVAWLLDLYGFKVYTLIGGYKMFRNWVLEQFKKDYPFIVVGGYTGSGKTEVLQSLQSSFNKNIIDLEGLAHHKGSAFGAINMPKQPSQEMFENKLAIELSRCLPDSNNTTNNPQEPVFIEDESQRIGTVNVPIDLWKQMRTKPLYFLQIPFEERLNYITANYGIADKDILVAAINRITKRLGGLETKNAIQFVEQGNIKEAFRILLHYYDKLYNKGLHNRADLEKIYKAVEYNRVNAYEIAKIISEYTNN